MPATTLDDANRAMKALRRQFVERMARDARALSSCADRLDDGSMPDAEIAVLRRICHSLIGSAARFGFDGAAAAAADVHAVAKAGESDGPKLGCAARELGGPPCQERPR